MFDSKLFDMIDDKKDFVRPIDAIEGKEDFVQPVMRSAENGVNMDVVRISMEQADPSPTAKDYCPVFCTQYTGHRQFDAYLTGEITCVRSYLNLIDILLAANENDVINIYIDSPGGRISAGGLIASAIDSSKATVRTIARGLCASAAALVHSAAKRGNASVSDFALMLYHMSSHVDEGVSTHIRARADVQVNYVNKVLLRKALEDGHITKEEFENLQSGENIIISGKEWNRRTQVTKD